MFYLLAYSEMIDQNYINDSTYLTTCIQHLKKFEAINNQNGELFKLYYYISSQYATIGINDSCEIWAKRGLNQKQMTPRFRAKCHRNLSEIYSSFSQHEKAIPHTIAFLDYFKEKNDTLNIGVAYFNLATLYKELFAYETTENYIKKAIEYSQLKNDTYTLAVYYQSMGNFYYETKNDSSKFISYSDSLVSLLSNNSNNLLFLESIKEEMLVNKFFITQQFDSIPFHLNKFGELGIKLEDSVSKKNYYIQKIRFEFQKTGKIANENEVEEIATYAISNKDFPLAKSCYLNLFNNAYKKGALKKAIEYQNKIHSLNEYIYIKNNQGQIYDKDIQYKTDNKDKELLLQREKLETKQRNIILLVLVIIILIMVLFIYIIYQKQKDLKTKRKTETLFTQKLMENTEDERMRIAKDLHDSIGHELLNVKNSISNKLQGNEEKIDRILDEVREISRNLFPVMFDEIGLKISLEQLASNIYKTDKLFIDTDLNYIDGTLNPKAELNIYRIIQEALNNTRKYAQAQSAKIIIDIHSNKVIVEILDNGKGFDVMEMLNSGKSFGLISINQRCRALNTNASIISNNSGTKIHIEILIKHV